MIIAFGAGFIGIIDSIRIGSLDPASPGLDIVLSGIVAASSVGPHSPEGAAPSLGPCSVPLPRCARGRLQPHRRERELVPLR